MPLLPIHIPNCMGNSQDSSSTPIPGASSGGPSLPPLPTLIMPNVLSRFRKEKTPSNDPGISRKASWSKSFLSRSPSTFTSRKSLFGSSSNRGTQMFPSTAQFPSQGLAPDGPPPAYDAPNTTINTDHHTRQRNSTETSADDPFSFLSTFDTVFVIDDSGSMAGNRWRECEQAITSITPICLAHDKDGIDIYFLNHPDSSEFKGIKTADDVRAIFQSVRPRSSTPTGTKLHKIITPYLKTLKDESLGKSFDGTFETKPLNIIVITDGVPTDELDAVIILAADKLDACGAPPWQVGIQFFQIGNDSSATEALRELDDNLGGRGDSGGKKVRDIVDTVPWTSETTGRAGLNAEGMLKVVLGAVNRRLDRKKNDESWRSMAGPASGSTSRR